MSGPKTRRSTESVEALASLLPVLQNSLAKVRVRFTAMVNPFQRIRVGRVPQKCYDPKGSDLHESLLHRALEKEEKRAS
jgi:hypothetical protein